MQRPIEYQASSHLLPASFKLYGFHILWSSVVFSPPGLRACYIHCHPSTIVPKTQFPKVATAHIVSNSSSVFKEGCVSIFKHFQDAFQSSSYHSPFPIAAVLACMSQSVRPSRVASLCGMAHAAVLRSSPQDRLRALGP